MSRLTPRVARGVVACVALAAALWVPWPEPVPRTLTFAFSTDAADVVTPAIDRFNEEHDDLQVRALEKPSGEAERLFAAGQLDAGAWMPSATAWAELLNEEAPRPLVDTERGRSSFWTPMAVVTWPSYVEAVDTWPEIFALAQGDRELPALAPDEAPAPFRFGHTRPTLSTSGLFATVEEFQEDVGSIQDPLTDDMRARLEQIEGSVSFYEDIGKNACDQIKLHTFNYFSVTYMQETVLVGCNKDVEPPMVAVYPRDQAFVADYPCLAVAVDETAEQDGDAFCDWLSKQQLDVGTFRPMPVPAPGETFQAGESAARPDELVTVKQQPSGPELLAMRDAWVDAHKRSSVVFVIDNCKLGLDSSEDANDAYGMVEGVLERLADDDPTTEYAVVRYADQRSPIDLRPVEDGIVERIPPSSDRACNPDEALLDVLTDSKVVRDDRLTSIVLIAADEPYPGLRAEDALHRELRLLASRRFAPKLVATSVSQGTDELVCGWAEWASALCFESSDFEDPPGDIADRILKVL